MRSLSWLIIHHGNKLFVLFMLVSVAGLLFAETPFNAPFVWASKWLTAPVLIVIPTFVYLERVFLFRRIKSRAKVYFVTLAMIPITILMSAGYVNFLNGCTLNPPTVVMEGPILEKFKTYSKGGSAVELRIKDQATGREVTFTARSREDAALSVGDLYRREMKKGLLGIPFDRRW